LYNPTTGQAKWKWTSPNPNRVRNIKEQWKRVKKAHAILTNPELREKYDTDRAVPAPAPKKKKKKKKKPNKSRATSSKVLSVSNPATPATDYASILARKQVEKEG